MKNKNFLCELGYKIILEEDPDVGGFTASVLEFPGCVTEGDTAEEAHLNIIKAAESWVAAVKELGQDVPPPLAATEYSGRVSLRLPTGLHGRLAELALFEGVSLNSLMVSMLAEMAGMRVGAQRGALTINTNYCNHRSFFAPPDMDLGDMAPASSTGETKFRQ